MVSIQDVLESLSISHKSRKVILPDITGEVVKSAIRRLKSDWFSPVICGTTEELNLYKDDINEWLEYFEVPKWENKLIFAAKKVLERDIYGFLWGNNESTGVTVGSIIKAKKQLAIPVERMTSHFVSEIDGRIILLADCALKNHDNPESFVSVIEQSIDAAKKYGIKKPSVAMLSYATNPEVILEWERWYEKHIDDIQTVVKILKEKYGPDFLIEGPVQLDAVMKPEVAIKKNPNTIFGENRPDILIYPSLEAWNIGYKTFNLMWAKTLWPILSWTLHDLSRGASGEDIYNSFIINIL